MLKVTDMILEKCFELWRISSISKWSRDSIKLRYVRDHEYVIFFRWRNWTDTLLFHCYWRRTCDTNLPKTAIPMKDYEWSICVNFNKRLHFFEYSYIKMKLFYKVIVIQFMKNELESYTRLWSKCIFGKCVISKPSDKTWQNTFQKFMFVFWIFETIIR